MGRRATTLFTLVLAVSILAGCQRLSGTLSSIAFPGNVQSNDRKGEETKLYFSPTVVNLDTLTPESYAEIEKAWEASRDEVGKDLSALESISAAGLAASATDQALGYLLKETLKFLEKEASLYDASYHAIRPGDAFYKDWSWVGTELNLADIVMRRKTSSGEAADIRFSLTPTLDNTAFFMSLHHACIVRSKAKLHSWSLLAPWSWYTPSAKQMFFGNDNDLDLTVRIVVFAVWVDSKAEGHTQLILDSEQKFNGLELGKKYSKSLLADGADPLEMTGSFLLPGIPRSHLGTLTETRRIPAADPNGSDSTQVIQSNIVGPGNFVVGIFVKEHDDYGKTVEAVAERAQSVYEEWSKK